MRLAAVFAVESNGLKCYARLTNTQILCLLSLATFAFGERVIYISDEEQTTTVIA